MYPFTHVSMLPVHRGHALWLLDTVVAFHPRPNTRSLLPQNMRDVSHRVNFLCFSPPRFPLLGRPFALNFRAPLQLPGLLGQAWC